MARPSRLAVVGSNWAIIDSYRRVLLIDGATGQVIDSLGTSTPDRNDPRTDAFISISTIASVGADSLRIYDINAARVVDVGTSDAGFGRPVVSVHFSTTVPMHGPLRARNGWISAGLFPDGRWMEFDLLGQATGIHGAVPGAAANDDRRHTPFVRQIVYEGTPTRSPDQRHLALACLHLGRVELFDSVGGHLVAADVPDPFPPRFFISILKAEPYPIIDQANGRRGYVDVTATDSAVYALYSGSPLSDPVASREGNYVHVFRWDGSRAGIFRLPVPAIAIALDGAAHTMVFLHRSAGSLFLGTVAVPPVPFVRANVARPLSAKTVN
jgi:hypothetical protein